MNNGHHHNMIIKNCLKSEPLFYYIPLEFYTSPLAKYHNILGERSLEILKIMISCGPEYSQKSELFLIYARIFFVDLQSEIESQQIGLKDPSSNFSRKFMYDYLLIIILEFKQIYKKRAKMIEEEMQFTYFFAEQSVLEQLQVFEKCFMDFVNQNFICMEMYYKEMKIANHFDLCNTYKNGHLLMNLLKNSSIETPVDILKLKKSNIIAFENHQFTGIVQLPQLCYETWTKIPAKMYDDINITTKTYNDIAELRKEQFQKDVIRTGCEIVQKCKQQKDRRIAFMMIEKSQNKTGFLIDDQCPVDLLEKIVYDSDILKT